MDSPEASAHTISAGQRVAIVGAPESGKTTLEMALVEGQGSVVVLDGKRDPQEWERYGRQRGFLITEDPEQLREAPRAVFLVPSLAIDDRAGWTRPGSVGYLWTRALQVVFERGGTLVVFGDALRLLPIKPNPHARRIFTEGRSRRLTALFDIYRATEVDPYALRLSEHCFAFAVHDQDDLETLRARRQLDPRPLTELERFHFAYHRLGAREWTLCDPVEPAISGPASRTRNRRQPAQKRAARAPKGAMTDPDA